MFVPTRFGKYLSLVSVCGVFFFELQHKRSGVLTGVFAVDLCLLLRMSLDVSESVLLLTRLVCFGVMEHNSFFLLVLKQENSVN